MELPACRITTIKGHESAFNFINKRELPKVTGKFKNPDIHIKELIRSSNQFDSKPKVIIITGANSGLGFVAAKYLFEAGHHIILACRSESKAKAAIKEIETTQSLGKVQFIPLDCSSLASVQNFAQEFKKLNLNLDILINNAGIMWVPYELTQDKIESQIGVNFLSHFLLTDLLIDKMHDGSKIINLSSLASFFIKDIDINQFTNPKIYHSGKNYAQSKLAALLFSTYLNQKLASKGILAYSVNPGIVKTNLYSNGIMARTLSKLGKFYMKDAASGTFTILRCALLPPPEGHGKPNVYYSEENLFKPPKASLNDHSIQQLILWANDTLQSLDIQTTHLSNY